MVKTLGFKTYDFINRYENLRQIVTFSIIGGFSAVVHLVLLYIFVQFFKIWYLLAAAIAFIIVTTVGFFFQKRYAFRYTRGDNKTRYVIFIFIAGSGILWELSLLFIFVEFFKLWYLEAAVIAKFIVLIWNFLLNKFVTFRQTEPASSQ